MRVRLLIPIVCVLLAVATAARADSHLDEFKARIEAALGIEDRAERTAALGALIHREGLDDWADGLAGRTAERLADLHGRSVSFAPLPADFEALHVVDGYEYRPNLEPLGYVVITDPAAASGNESRIPYGLNAEDGRYYVPATVRRLVNPDAPPDKTLQILTIGIAHPAVTYEGWCEIALSNGTTRRVTLNDQGVGNQTLLMHGQSIEACEVTNTAGRGSLSLRLYEDDREIFMRRIETPEATITYGR